MRYVCPDYYPMFRCAAERCQHNCCIGWEIDIDKETLKRYDHVKGPLGDRLRRGIVRGSDGACFRLDEQEQCPFLNDKGLCDIIMELSEDYLCQICGDHPRFRSFYNGVEEIGLGLCCEAAARLILTREEPMVLIELQNTGEVTEQSTDECSFFEMRNCMFISLQDRSLNVEARMRKVEASVGLTCSKWSSDVLADIFRQLEILSSSWEARLMALSDSPKRMVALPETNELFYEQFLCYLVYRHLQLCLEEWDVQECVILISLMAHMIAALPADGTEELLELARQLSSEVEYSDENLHRLHTIIDILREDAMQ